MIKTSSPISVGFNANFMLRLRQQLMLSRTRQRGSYFFKHGSRAS